MGLQMNVKKTKVLTFEKEVARTDRRVGVDNVVLDEMDLFVYVYVHKTRMADTPLERRICSRN